MRRMCCLVLGTCTIELIETGWSWDWAWPLVVWHTPCYIQQLPKEKSAKIVKKNMDDGFFW